MLKQIILCFPVILSISPVTLIMSPVTLIMSPVTLIMSPVILIMSPVILSAAKDLDAPKKPITLTQLKTTLGKYQTISGNFIQRRSIKSVGAELDSKGKFTIKKSKELDWHQEEPFVLNFKMTRDKVIQTDTEGDTQVIHREDQPLLFAISSILLDVFSFDEKLLRQYFELNWISQSRNWRLRLEPKVGPLQKGVSEIKLSGRDFVDSVEVIEKGGSQMTLVFSKVRGS